MKPKAILIMALLMLFACRQQGAEVTDQSTANASEEAASGIEIEDPALPEFMGGFKKPLPMGVVLSLPHKARMDVAVTNESGRRGRRTEFVFLQGDAAQAMRSFSKSMVAAGFQPEEPTDDSGVIRQVFNKAGYGPVFARAEEASGDTLKDPEAKGFLVAAWPSDTANDY